MIRHGKKKNVAVAAVARELACFVWGMMTGNSSINPMAGTSSSNQQYPAACCCHNNNNRISVSICKGL